MLLFAAVALLALAEPSAAPPTQAAPAAAAKPAKPEVVCHKEMVVGSKLPVKVCMTKADAAERKAQDREALERAQTLQTQRSN